MNCICQNAPQRPGINEVLDSLERHTVCTGTQCFEDEADAFGVTGPANQAPSQQTMFFMLMMCGPPGRLPRLFDPVVGLPVPTAPSRLGIRPRDAPRQGRAAASNHQRQGTGRHRVQIIYFFRMQIGSRTPSRIGLGSGSHLDRIRRCLGLSRELWIQNFGDLCFRAGKGKHLA